MRRRSGSSYFLRQKRPRLLPNTAAQPDQGDPAGPAKRLCGGLVGQPVQMCPSLLPASNPNKALRS